MINIKITISIIEGIALINISIIFLSSGREVNTLKTLKTLINLAIAAKSEP